MSKWLCCSLETIQTSVAVSAYVVFWNMWQKLNIAAIRLKSKLGTSQLVTPCSFFIPQLYVLPSVFIPNTLQKWRHRMRPWNSDSLEGTCKAGAGTQQVQAGLGALSSRNSCSELRDMFGRAHRRHTQPKGSLNMSNWKQIIIPSSLPKPQPPLYTQISEVFSLWSLYAKVNQSIQLLDSNSRFQDILCFLQDMA